MAPKTHISFHCPLCYKLVPANTFADHCHVTHSLLPSQCPWCFGHTRLGRGDKHTAPCFEQFMKALPRPMPLEPHRPEPVPFDLQPMCSTQPQTLHLPMIDLDSKHPLAFQDASLNLAVASLRLFLQEDAYWYHVMARDAAWSNLTLPMLPFTCLCHGGGGGGPLHRHALLRSSTAWKAPKGIRKRRIESPMDLLLVLDALSQEESTCDYTFRDHGGEKRKNHTHVAVSLPRLHALVLALQWEGGIVDWIHREYAALDASVLAPAAFLADQLWVVKFRDLPGLENWTVPVSAECRPCANETPWCLHLDRGEKVYFKRGKEEEEEKEEKRDVNLMDLVGEYWYYPTLQQQRCLNAMKPYVDAVEGTQGVLDEQVAVLDALQQSVEKLKRTKRGLKRKWAASEKEYKVLQYKHIRFLETENDQLRLKCEEVGKESP